MITYFFFFFNDTATTEIYTLSLHDALPIAAVHNDTRGPAHGAHNAATRPDRDHYFARIWRVQHKEAKKLTALSLDDHNSAAWINALSSENGWLRMTAHRLISERGGEPEAKTLSELLQN